MNRNVCLLVTVMMTLSAGLLGAQTLPVRLYGDSLSEQALALVEGVGSGFCIGGWTNSYGSPPGLGNALVVKTDARGAPVWCRMSQGENDEWVRSMVRTSGSCYVLTGFTRSDGPGVPAANIFVTKLDTSGNTVWSRVYGGYQDDDAFSIVETPDRGFAVCGRTWSYGPMPTPNIFVLRLDSLGLFMWMRVYWMSPNHVSDEGYSICVLPDTGFAVCGRANVTGPTQIDPFLLKLGPAGNVQWCQIVPGTTNQDGAQSVALDGAGNIIVSGWTHSYGMSPNGPCDLFAARFTLGSGLLWSRTFGWANGNEMPVGDRALAATSDGGSAVCCLTTSVGPGVPNPNFLLLKLNANGQLVWTRSHPSPYDPGLGGDVPTTLIQRTGGGYAVAGFTNSWPNKLGGGDDWMLSTFDTAGNRPVCAEPQYPEVESMPWEQWSVEYEYCEPEADSMAFEPVTVNWDSACYDTNHTAVESGRSPLRRNDEWLQLAIRGSRVALNLQRSALVRVAAFFADGRQAAVLAGGEMAAGRHELAMPAGLSAGTYIVRAQAGETTASVKVARF